MPLTRTPDDRTEVRWPWLAAAFGLSFGFIAMHEFSQATVQSFRDRIGSDGFHLVFGLVGLAVLAVTLTLSVRWARASHALHRTRSKLLTTPSWFWAAWTLLIVFAALTYWTLVAVHSELIHLLQYLLLLLVFQAAFGRLGMASAWAFLISVIDEGYQYWVLRRGWNSYYDFNDLVLNQVGIALGAALVLSAAPPAGEFRWHRALGRAWFIPGLVALCLIVGLLSGWLGIERATSLDATFVLTRSGAPPTFWTHAEWSGKDFHILAPIPGLLLTALSCLPLLLLDGWSGRRHRT